MTLAILCSGQGIQHSRMFALTGDAPEAAYLFRHTERLLGRSDPREMVRTEASNVLHHDRIGQILCSLQGLAAASALREVMPDRLVVAGYSVGEVAAWGVAGFLSMIDTLDLVACRAEAMDAASSPGDGLLFIRGLCRNSIERLCERYEAGIAIVNPGNAFIVGGSRIARKGLAAKAKEMKASRVVDVPVEVAAHTKRLSNASPLFRKALSQRSVTPPPRVGTWLLSGIDGAPVSDLEAGLDKLAAQISQTVEWETCLHSCMEAGATAFFELGPGAALSKMLLRDYDRYLPVRSIEDFKTLEGARSWLKCHAGP